MKTLFSTLCGSPRDILWGVLNALIVCAVVYLVNMGEYHQYTVVFKQGVYAFFIGSSMVRIARYVSRWAIQHYYIPNVFAVWCGISSAWVINLMLNILLHSIGGTPDPMTTIMVVALLTMIGLVISGYIETARLHQEQKTDRDAARAL